MWTPRKNDEEGIINVFYVPHKKQKVHIRRVVTQGNTRTRDNVIFRELRLADGDQFDGSQAAPPNERLNRLRYLPRPTPPSFPLTRTMRSISAST